VIAPKDWTIGGAQWLKNGHIAVFIKVSRVIAGADNIMRTWYRTASVDIAGGKDVLLLSDTINFNTNVSVASIEDRDVDDPNDIFMALLEYSDMRSGADDATRAKLGRSDEKISRLQLYRTDVTSGRSSRFMAGSYDTREWHMDGRGRVLARVDQVDHPLRDRVFALDGDSWRQLGDYDATGDHGANILGVTDDGTALVRPGLNANNVRILARLDLKTGKEAVLFSDPKYDADEPVRDPWTDRVIGATFTDDKVETRYFDPKLQALQKGLEAAFPGAAVHAVSWDRTLEKLIIKVDGPKKPIEYYFLNRTTHITERLGSAYPELQGADLGATQPYPYKARDGLDIPAYLTLPPGKAAKNLPVVMMPHGGPDVRDEIRFDWMAQFFANRGYAVLQPNYRGSWGYGQAFNDAGHRQWGLKMQDDLTDGVRKLVADGIANPKRVCIVGASYGGYAALAGAALTPHVYACAVSFAGLSDLPKFISEERARYGENSVQVSSWISRIGSSYADSEQLAATSPARHADQIRCPVLLMHGEGDSTVPVEQSELMADAMKSAGRPVEFIRFPGEDHYFNFADTRIRFLKETEAFLKKNIGN